MNPDEAREQLIDLVYGELDEPRKGELLRLVKATPELRQELDRLMAARAALSLSRSGEPRSPARSTGILPVCTAGILPSRLAGSPPVRVSPAAVSSSAASSAAANPTNPRRKKPLRFFWKLAPLSALAAGLIAALLILFPPTSGRHGTAVAQSGVEIKKTDISLTILSEPDEQSVAPLYERQALQSWQGEQAYNFNDAAYASPGWKGLALVRDQRLIRNLPKGASEVRFADVPVGIVPESVRLRSLDEPKGLTILEQNYQYDLASADNILRRYVDKPISIAPQDGKEVTGNLLAFDYGSFVVRPPNEGPRNVSREKLQAVRMGELPKGLLTRPTLVWTVDNQAALNQRLEVAYMTSGISWRADYVLRVKPGAAGAPFGNAKPQADAKSGQGAKSTSAGTKEEALANPQVWDGAELVGWATVTNRSGVTYENAQLKLMAGDVHLVQEERRTDIYLGMIAANQAAEAKDDKGFEEKSFFEYHLYTLGRSTTLANAETKQIELVSGNGIRMSRGYVFDPQENNSQARVVSEFKNSEQNGLGKPLPKGVIRLYAPDPTGEETYVSQTTIDHTPKDEKVRLPWGYAFDIACSARQTDNKVRGKAGSQKWQYVLRNHKDYDVTVTIMVHVPQSATQAECTAPAGGRTTSAAAAAQKHPWHVREVGLVEIEVPVKSNASAVVDFSFQYDNANGGGLVSPWDQ